jgi:protein TonB
MEIKKYTKADVGRNSSIYFAVGLNIMLCLTYLGMEYKTNDKDAIDIGVLSLNDELEQDIPINIIDLPPPPPPKPAVTVDIVVVDDSNDIEETIIESTEIGQDDVIEEREVSVDGLEVIEVDEDIEVPFSIIEFVPIFPGCKGNNKELKACFQKKMTEHLMANFKYPEAAQELNIQGKVYVFFIIDKTGLVTNIKSRGPDKMLEDEAKRIISVLPKMKPGRQRDRSVSVPYSIPINFKVIN